MEIRTSGNKRLNLSELPADMQALFCSKCGTRLGFVDVAFSDNVIAYCDDCTADNTEDKSWDNWEE